MPARPSADPPAHPLAVMKRLGHSSITVTYDRHTKLFPERDAEIVAGVEAGRARALTAVPEPSAEVIALLTVRTVEVSD